MGLFGKLGKSRYGSVLLKWQEPAEFRVRLRGDLLWRGLIALGVWCLSTTLFIGLFSINQNPPGLGTAFGLGLIGFGFAMMVLFFRSGQVSGRLELREHGLKWQATSTGLLMFNTEFIDCEYDEIRRCTIFPDERIGFSFSVMVVSLGGEHCMFGIPGRIGHQKVASVLKRSGVEVTLGRKLPGHYRQGLSPIAGALTGGVGLVAVIVAVMLFSPRDKGDAGRGNRIVQNRNPVMQPPVRDRTNPAAGLPPRAGSGGPAPADTRPSIPSPFVPKPNSPQTRPNVPQTRPDVPRTQPDLPETRPPAVDDPAQPSEAKTVAAGSMIGGAGGFPFEHTSPDGRLPVGLACSIASWGGKERVGQLETLFDRSQQPRYAEAIVGRDGFAIGAVLVQADQLVDAVALVFMRLKPDGSLDAAEQYTSKWIGRPTDGAEVKRIETNGRPVTGFRGRRGAVLDAIGVVVAPK